jgi:hypothetical protein
MPTDDVPADEEDGACPDAAGAKHADNANTAENP